MIPIHLSVPVARPPWTTLGRKLESMCRKALYDFKLLEGVTKLGVALSGGKDSLSLLFLLKAILGNGFPEVDLIPIHVTGEFSCGAGVSIPFLKGICQELDLPFILCESKQKRETLECYSCSRKRRKLIFEAAKEAGANTVAFGHHRDDSIQTLLMNLLHKAEFAANLPKVPMHDFGVAIIRPLIYVPEEDLSAFAKMHGFARVVCQCPVGQESLRKSTKDLIDQIAKVFPHAKENLAQAAFAYGSDKATRKRES